MAIFELLKNNPELGKMWIDDLCVSSNMNDFLDRLEFYKKLCKWNLADFFSFNKGVELMQLWEYSVRVSAWHLESYGWIHILIMKWGRLIMKVWWFIYWNWDEAYINNIQWRRQQKSEWNDDNWENFRQWLWIMPANLLILIFLKLSQLIWHNKICIKWYGDNAYCYWKVNSPLYDIPKFYFRIQRTVENNYEFDWKKRDVILEKFAWKNPTVATAFWLLEKYYQSL